MLKWTTARYQGVFAVMFTTGAAVATGFLVLWRVGGAAPQRSEHH